MSAYAEESVIEDDVTNYQHVQAQEQAQAQQDPSRYEQSGTSKKDKFSSLLPERFAIDKSTKNVQDAFLRIDSWSLYEILKTVFVGIPILIPIRGLLALVTIGCWVLYTKLLVFNDWMYCACFCSDGCLERKKTIDDFEAHSCKKWLYSWLSSLSRFGLFLGGFYKIHRLYVSSKQLSELRAKYSISDPNENTETAKSNNVDVVGDENDDGELKSVVISSPSDELRPCYTIVSNHLSMLDVFIHLQEFGPLSMLGKGTLSKIPIISIIIEQMNCLLYDHRTKSRLLDMMKEREEIYNKDSSKSRLIIYPEGTTTNGKYLITMHRGAFANGSPVQPVIIHHPFKHFNVAWDSINSIHFFLRLLSQFVNYCTIVHFPPYHPTTFEKENPDIYAENVRRIMCHGTNLLIPEKDMRMSKCFFTRVIRPPTEPITN